MPEAWQFRPQMMRWSLRSWSRNLFDACGEVEALLPEQIQNPLTQQQSYEQILKRHLEAYRLGRLGGVESGVYESNGTTRPYGHILPTDLKWLNILEPFRLEVKEYQVANGLSLHRYFHHLNSSQAFTFNLFIPLFQHAPEALAAALQTRALKTLQLEYCADPVERTQVDVLWTIDEATQVYCEVKLSESEFGSTDGLGRHQRKLEETYRPMLGKHVSEAIWEANGAIFFKFYQVYRNLWLAARPGRDTDQVRFLLPRANIALSTQLSEALDFVRAGLRSRTQILYIEDVLRQIARLPQTAWYGGMLEEKYVPASDLRSEPFPAQTARTTPKDVDEVAAN
jgi:hypothetical protein